MDTSDNIPNTQDDQAPATSQAVAVEPAPVPDLSIPHEEPTLEVASEHAKRDLEDLREELAWRDNDLTRVIDGPHFRGMPEKLKQVLHATRAHLQAAASTIAELG